MTYNTEIMNIKQVAEYLQMSERGIQEWAKEEIIPAFKLGNSWRFKKSDIDGWIESKRTGPSPNTFPKSNYKPLTSNIMEKKINIEKFKKTVINMLNDRPGSNKVYIHELNIEFNKEVINKGLKELEDINCVIANDISSAAI